MCVFLCISLVDNSIQNINNSLKKLIFLDSYEHALQKEKRLMKEKNNTESESQLSRG